MRFRLRRRLPDGCMGRVSAKAYREAAADPVVIGTARRERETWREWYGYYPGESNVKTAGTKEEPDA